MCFVIFVILVDLLEFFEKEKKVIELSKLEIEEYNLILIKYNIKFRIFSCEMIFMRYWVGEKGDWGWWVSIREWWVYWWIERE